MFPNRVSQSPLAAAGAVAPDLSRPDAMPRRRRLRWVNLVSAAMLATILSGLMVLAGEALGGASQWGMALGLVVTWLVLFLALSLLARACARLALRVVAALRRPGRSGETALSDHALYARTVRDPQLSGDVQALLDAGANQDDNMPALFTAPRYCRYL